MIAPEEAVLRRRQAIGLIWLALVILFVLRDTRWLACHLPDPLVELLVAIALFLLEVTKVCEARPKESARNDGRRQSAI